MSLREVSRRVGVTHAAAYHHFASKDSLVVAVSEQGFSALLTDLDAELAREYVGFFSLIDPALIRALCYAQSLDVSVHVRDVASANVPPSSGISTCLRDLPPSPIARSTTSFVKRGQGERAAAQFWSTVHGLASLVTAGALDGAPRAKATKRTAKQRERRAHEHVRATVGGMLVGTKPPDSKWRPKPPGKKASGAAD